MGFSEMVSQEMDILEMKGGDVDAVFLRHMGSEIRIPITPVIQVAVP